jgi:hypothetical protein
MHRLEANPKPARQRSAASVRVATTASTTLISLGTSERSPLLPLPFSADSVGWPNRLVQQDIPRLMAFLHSSTLLYSFS